MLRKIAVAVMVAVLAVFVTAPATAIERDVTEWYTWEVNGPCDPAVLDDKDAGWQDCSDNPFPQQLVGKGKHFEPPCGVWYQVDKYTGTRAEIDAVIDGNELTMTNGVVEDHKVVKDWYFTYGGDCEEPEPKKVFVCKYVGTPGVDERLQTGNNPISVSVNAISNYQGVGSWFNDAHGRSFVIAEDNTKGGGQSGEPSINDCPQPDGPDPKIEKSAWVDGTWECNDTTVTQTRTKTVTPYKLVDNEWVLDTENASVTEQTRVRELTDNEFEACPPELKYVIVAWEMPSWTGSATWPQTYVHHEKIATIDVNALDGYLDENFDYGCFQIDVYHDSQTTTDLIAGGYLTSPNNPNEDHVPGGAWKFVRLGNACEAPEPVFSCEYIDGQSVKVTHEDGVLPKDAIEWTEDGCAPPPEPVYSCVWDEQTETSIKVTHESGVLPDGAIPWTEDGCEPPKEDVKVAVCEYDEETATANRVEYSESELPETYVLWEDGSECTPPVLIDVCEYNEQTGQGEKVTYEEGQTPREYITWVDGSECEPPTEPTLEGTLFSPMCFADVPWIDYNIQLNDPDNQVAPGSLATITLFDTDLDEFGDPLNSLVLTDQPLGGHEFLWPGADAINNGDGTWTANGWPGWSLVDDEWVSVGEDNFGWTRNGVNIKVEVNPEFSTTLSYPPATWECTDPPTEIHNELPAPPAKPVTAEAQFAG